MISEKSKFVLNICVGLPGLVDDTSTGELGYHAIPLNNTDGAGLTLRPIGGWSPQIAPLKAGGAYLDTPTLDGAEITTDAVTNVTETFTCQLHAENERQMATVITELSLWLTRARRFFTEYNALDPVYIEWKPIGIQVHQYALIKDIDISIKDGRNTGKGEQLVREVVIKAVREPYWRIGVAPGDNPKKWAFIQRGQFYDSGNQMFLLASRNAPTSSQESFQHATLTNKIEHTQGQSNSYVNQNFLTISGEDIPGDVPALTSVGVYFDTGSNTEIRRARVMCARKTTREIPIDSGVSGTIRDSLIHNGGDAELITAGSITVTYPTGDGPNSYSTSVSQATVEATIPSGALSDDGIIGWGDGRNNGVVSGSSYGYYFIRENALRGKYNVFLRHRLKSGTATDLDLYARVGIQSSVSGDPPQYDYVESTLQGNPISVTTSNRFALLDLGTIEIPVGHNPALSFHGDMLTGLRRGDLYIDVRHRARSAGGAVVIEISDLIFMPFDEDVFTAICPSSPVSTNASANNQLLMVDNTGYLSRGRNETRGLYTSGEVSANNLILNYDGLIVPEVRGDGITLLPGEDNRLYFLNTHNIRLSASTYEEVSEMDDNSISGTQHGDMIVSLNIVPRCRYINDVEVT